MEGGIPVKAGTPPAGEAQVKTLPPYRCASLLCWGGLEHIGQACGTLMQAIGEAGLEQTGEEREWHSRSNVILILRHAVSCLFPKPMKRSSANAKSREKGSQIHYSLSAASKSSGIGDNRMRIKSIAVVMTVLAGCVLASCVRDRWVEIKPGEYAAVRGIGTASEAAIQGIQKVEIDRDKHTATFSLVDGSQIVTSFVSRERAVWPDGCPSNINSTRMEVLDIQESTLTIESATFSNPILVRNCPPDPMYIALREDGRVGGSWGACTEVSECIIFGR